MRPSWTVTSAQPFGSQSLSTSWVSLSSRYHAHPWMSCWPPSMSKVAGDRGVRHEVKGQGGDVGRADDAADRQRGAELLAALLDPVAGQGGRQRRADKACRDQVDP